MKKVIFAMVLLFMGLALAVGSAEAFEEDTFDTSKGDLKITFIGHGTLMISFDGKIIHIDPVSQLADYTALPKADLILITHHHGDHLDPQAIHILRKDNTKLIQTEMCREKIPWGTVMKNGDVKTVQDLEIKAVPAYNIQHMRSPGHPFHPKGEGNGYVITFGDKRIYIAGDTENIPEMKALEDVDAAFLPMNLPYTMTPDMVADAAKSFRPKILYPYHYGDTDTSSLLELLKDEEGIEVRIRNMK